MTLAESSSTTAVCSRADFVAAAREELETPFHHQGRALKQGLDCSGLIVAAAKRCGIVLANDRTDYPRLPRPTEFLEDMRRGLEGLDLAVPEARIGDVLIFWLSNRLQSYHFPQHCAIITEVEPEPLIVHAVYERKKVVEHRLDLHWSPRVLHAFHVPGVAWSDEGESLGLLPHLRAEGA
jgi:hypothetical protein